MRITVIDTETNGLEPDAALLEVATVEVLPSGELGGVFSTLVRYDGQLNPVARAVHHIHPRSLTSELAQDRDLVMRRLASEEMFRDAYAAHNAKFDSAILSELTLPFICTMRCARHLFPDAPGYSNQVLRYHLELDDDLSDFNRDLLSKLEPHRALYDAIFTALLLRRMLLVETGERLLELTGTPVLLSTCPLKKYKGRGWREIDAGYLHWILGQDDMDEDVRYTAKRELDRRSLLELDRLSQIKSDGVVR